MRTKTKNNLHNIERTAIATTLYTLNDHFFRTKRTVCTRITESTGDYLILLSSVDNVYHIKGNVTTKNIQLAYT